ncbi:tigger transposable element-derived protein 4 [Ixodes scapularis]
MVSHASSLSSGKETRVAKRNSLTIETKLRMLSELKTGVVMKNVARKYRIANSTLSTIIKNADRLRENSASGLGKRKRFRPPDYADIEESLYKWFVKERAQHATIDGAVLRAKAQQLATSLNYENFQASNGWLSRFKQRYRLSSPRKMSAKREEPTQATVQVPEESSGRVNIVDVSSSTGLLQDANTQAGAGVLDTGSSFMPSVLLCFLDRNCAQTQTILPVPSRNASTDARVKLADKGCSTANL